jgi:hypothetical protein
MFDCDEGALRAPSSQSNIFVLMGSEAPINTKKDLKSYKNGTELKIPIRHSILGML